MSYRSKTMMRASMMGFVSEHRLTGWLCSAEHAAEPLPMVVLC